MENPSEPTIIEEEGGSTIIKCPRCTKSPHSISGGTAKGTGQMLTFVNENRMSNVVETTTCTVCRGKERLKVPDTPPLSVCLRCRGLGSIVQRDERMPILDEIQQLEQQAKTKKESQESDGFLDLIKEKVTRTEEEKEIASLRGELPDESKRNLHIETCPSCDGTGLDSSESGPNYGFLTECQRCVGTGRMIIEIQEDPFTLDTYALVIEDGCDVCNGDGTVSIYGEEPPLVTCTNCDGTGQINTHEGYPPRHKILQTCRTCTGFGFVGTNSIRTV